MKEIHLCTLHEHTRIIQCLIISVVRNDMTVILLNDTLQMKIHTV